jgi:hypothetical protein
MTAATYLVGDFWHMTSPTADPWTWLHRYTSNHITTDGRQHDLMVMNGCSMSCKLTKYTAHTNQGMYLQWDKYCDHPTEHPFHPSLRISANAQGPSIYQNISNNAKGASLYQKCPGY